MKKLCVTVLTFLTCGMLYALPVGNPSDASLLTNGLFWEGLCPEPCDPCVPWHDAVSFRLGFYGDYVFNRHLELDTDRDAVIEDAEIFTNAAYLALNFYERFDIFSTLGVSNLFIDTSSTAFIISFDALVESDEFGRTVIESSSDFSWSIGARATLWELGCTSLGAEAQYFYMKPNIRRVTVNASTQTGIISLYNDFFDAKYREWQFGLGISHRFHSFIPYLAVKWSRAKLSFDNIQFTIENFLPREDAIFQLYNLKSQKSFGWAIGCSLVDFEKVSLTVEGRFADEKALHVNGQLRF